ncbi:hypothetical protein BDY24DRAFT_381557 [Mrakia frigida]|uniref:uncharacterized protein n=1 Tax=Mrakia frigida TaxID=29902 RepID=UPI003FCBFF24
MSANVNQLVEYGFSEPKSIYALSRCDNNTERALDWMFSREGIAWDDAHPTPPFYESMPALVTAKDVRFDASVDSNKAIGDSGADDDEDFKRAMALSLDESTTTTSTDPSSSISTPVPSPYVPPRPPTPNPNFTPSNRSDPDNKFGLIQLPKPDLPSTEEQNFQRAMDESLMSSSNHALATPPSDTVRSPGAPICLWTGEPTYDHVVAVFMGLYAVPQLRALLFPGVLRPPGSYTSGSAVDYLLEIASIFEDLETGEASEESYLDFFKQDVTLPLNPAYGSPVHETRNLLKFIFESWSAATPHLKLEMGGLPPRLLELFSQPNGFQTLFTSSGSDGRSLPNPREADIVARTVIELEPSDEIHSIPLAFARQLWTNDGQGAFIEPAEVMALTLEYPTYGPRKLFEIQEEFYIDRFLAGNSSTVAKLRAHDGVLKGGEDSFRLSREKLATVKGKDVRATLVTVLKYYKEVARPSDDPVDNASRLASTAKIEKLIAQLDNEQDAITESLKSLVALRENLFEKPELQKYKYELRAILYHDGIYGTGHIYSYVRTSDGKWWKMSDGIAKEVDSKQALNDASGLHLGAGPFALLYSRAEDWPQTHEFPDAVGSAASASALAAAVPVGGYDDPNAGGGGGGGVGFDAAGGKDSWVPDQSISTVDTSSWTEMDLQPLPSMGTRNGKMYCGSDFETDSEGEEEQEGREEEVDVEAV